MLPTETIITRLILAIVLGAFIGLERDNHLLGNEKQLKLRNRDGSKEAKRKFAFINTDIPASGLGGLRTYILISLLGAVSGLAVLYGVGFAVWIFGGGVVLFILVSFVLNYFDKNTFGLTTEMSIMLTFLLSFLLLSSEIDVRIIVALYIVNALVLSVKTETKHIVSKFSRKEVMDTAKFALFTIVILQFLPDINYMLSDIPVIGNIVTHTFGLEFASQLDFFNPYKLWLIVVFVSGLNFVGYFLVKVLGKDRGLNVIGFLGGMISSTGVTEAMAIASKHSKSKSEANAYVNAALLANFSSFLRIIVVTAMVNIYFIKYALFPLLAMSITMLVIYLWPRLMGKDSKEIAIKENIKANSDKIMSSNIKKLGLSFHSPFSFKPALIFGMIYIIVLGFTKVTLHYLGESGFLLSSFISSLSGMDAITISTASFAGSEVSYEIAALVLIIATSINLAAKALLASFLSNNFFRKKLLYTFSIVIIVGVVVFALL